MANRPVKVRQGTSGPLLKGSAGQVATQDGPEDISMQNSTSGSGAPLSNVFYVDAGTTVVGSDGSIGKPFPNGDDAIDALNATARPGSLYFTPNADLGSYAITSEPAVDTAFVGMNSNELDPVGSPAAVLSGTVNNTAGKNSFQNLTFADSDFASASTTSTEVDGCHIGVDASFDVGDTTAVITDSFLDTGVVVTFTGGAGTLYLDAATYYWWLQNGGTVNNGTVVVMAAGGIINPLTNTAFVDAGFTLSGPANGSIAAPFATIQAAIDEGFSSILVAPGTYADPIAISDAQITIQSLDANPASVVISGAINVNALCTLTLVGVTWTSIQDNVALPDTTTLVLHNAPGGTITGSDGTILKATADTSAVLGACDALGNATLRNIACTGVMSATLTVTAFNSSFDADLNAAFTNLTDCNTTLTTGTVNTNSLNAKGTNFGGDVTTGTPTDTAEDCTFSGTANFVTAKLTRCVFNDDCHANGNLNAIACAWQTGQLRVDGIATFDNCTIEDAAATALFLNGAGVSSFQNCVWSGVLQMGDGVFRHYDSTFKKAIATTAPGTAEFRNCVFDTSGGSFSINSAKLFFDSASEINALLANVSINVTIHVLDSSQDGNAMFISDNNDTVDFTDETRGVLGQNVLSANRTLEIDTTGSVGDTQTWKISNYNRTAHTLDVVDDTAAAIVSLGTVPAGTALLYTFGISQTTHKAVLVSIDKIVN